VSAAKGKKRAVGDEKKKKTIKFKNGVSKADNKNILRTSGNRRDHLKAYLRRKADANYGDERGTVPQVLWERGKSNPC